MVGGKNSIISDVINIDDIVGEIVVMIDSPRKLVKTLLITV